jgi:hypothetical protein
MKKRNYIFVAFILICTIAACKSKSSSDNKDEVKSGKTTFTTAVEYNDFIIGQQEKVIKAVLSMSDVMNAEKINNDDLKARYADFGKECKRALDTIKTMDEFNGNKAFRDEAIKLFEFYYEIYQKDYKELVDILVKGEKIADADVARMKEIQESITQRENVRDGAFADAQNKFAAENNMQIVPNDVQKQIDKQNK